MRLIKMQDRGVVDPVWHAAFEVFFDMQHPSADCLNMGIRLRQKLSRFQRMGVDLSIECRRILPQLAFVGGAVFTRHSFRQLSPKLDVFLPKIAQCERAEELLSGQGNFDMCRILRIPSGLAQNLICVIVMIFRAFDGRRLRAVGLDVSELISHGSDLRLIPWLFRYDDLVKI